MKSLGEVFAGLRQSEFRSRIKLRQKEIEYLRRKGMDVIMEHAVDFIEKRLTAAYPFKDGKQTPWGGHPVFVAQHATATCCRSCLEKWHGIAKGQELNAGEKQHIIEAIRLWLSPYTTAPGDDNSG